MMNITLDYRLKFDNCTPTTARVETRPDNRQAKLDSTLSTNNYKTYPLMTRCPSTVELDDGGKVWALCF